MVLDMAADGGAAVKMVVSYGGEITRCSDTGKARYSGGENRVVRVGMSERLSSLRARLAALAGYPDPNGVRIRYSVAGPGGGDGLDALRDVADDHDLWVLVTRLCCCDGLAARDGRVRAFLFPAVASVGAPAPAPPRLTTDGIVVGIPRPASSPSLLQRGAAAAARAATSCTLPRAQSAKALPTCAPVSSMAFSSDGGSSTTRVDSGFEALAEIAAAQRSETGDAAASSSVTSSSSSGAAAAASTSSSTGQADRGFEAALATTVAVAGAGAGQQRVQAFPPPAATAVPGVFMVVTVAPVAVFFFHAIPVYGCSTPAVL